MIRCWHPLSMLWYICTPWHRCKLWRAQIWLVTSRFCRGDKSNVAVWPHPSSLQRVLLARLMNYGFHKQKFYIVSQARPTFSKRKGLDKLCIQIVFHHIVYSAVMVLVSLVPRQDFSRLLENCVWSTTYSIFVQVGQNAGRLFFSNLTLDIIEDCIIA